MATFEIKDGVAIIPEGTTEISNYAFDDCRTLESIVIPESVTEIGYAAFFRCTSLKSIIIPESVTKIGEAAFVGCSSLESIAFVSTGIHQTYPISSKVLLIGGQLDHSAGSLPGAYKTLKSNGTQTDIYWNKEASHFAFFIDQKEILEFINKNI